MGGCASKPKDLDTENMPARVEAPAVPAETRVASENAEAETVAQEVKHGDENKEEPLVDVYEPAAEASNIEEAITTEAAAATEEAVEADVEPIEATAKAVEDAKELPKEEKKEVAETVATA